MKHLVVGLFLISLMIMALCHDIVEVKVKVKFNFKLITCNKVHIIEWIARLMLGLIIASWLR